MGAADPSAASPAVHDPVRTCVGCRTRAPAVQLLRVVADPVASAALARSIRPDPRRRAPGRGAWLHPDPRCLAQAERRRAFGRALRVPAGVGSSAVHRYLEQWIELRQQV